MAIEKPKVIAAIETKYKRRGLSKSFINHIAKQIADQLDDEAEIEETLNNYDFLIEGAIKEGDRRGTLAAQQGKGDNGNQQQQQQSQGGASRSEDDEDTPPWAKPIIASLQAVVGAVQTLQQKETKSTIEQRFMNDPRLKGIPEKLLKRYMPEKAEDLEKAIEDAEADLDEFRASDDANDDGKGDDAGKGSNGQQQQQNNQQQQGNQQSNQKFGKDRPGGNGNQRANAGKGGKPKEATKEEVAAAMKLIPV